jgi:signal recognition particle subunit SEC65
MSEREKEIEKIINDHHKTFKGRKPHLTDEIKKNLVLVLSVFDHDKDPDILALQNELNLPEEETEEEKQMRLLSQHISKAPTTISNKTINWALDKLGLSAPVKKAAKRPGRHKAKHSTSIALLDDEYRRLKKLKITQEYLSSLFEKIPHGEITNLDKFKKMMQRAKQ